jgi:tetratricopeptide (TPR) repeat protein
LPDKTPDVPKDKPAMIDLPAPLFAVEHRIEQQASFMQIGPATMPMRPSDLPIPRRRDPEKEREAERKAGLDRPQLPEQDRLAYCLQKAASDPDAAMVEVQTWLGESRDTGQQVRANQCLGMLRSNAGDFAGAAEAFGQAIAGVPKEQEVAAVPLMGMAGNAALAAGQAEAAVSWFDRALAVKGAADNAAQADLQIDRSRALVAQNRFAEAASALDEAHRLAPEDAEGWLLSATLARRQEELDRAQRDIEIAAKYAPRDPRVGLEAGVIAVLSGRDDAARKSWESVVAAYKDGEAGKTARGYLEQLGPAPKSVSPETAGKLSS